MQTHDKDRIRVLHFRNCRGISTLTGPETYLLDLLQGIDTDRFELTLVCMVNARTRDHMFLERLHEAGLGVEVVATRHALDFSDFGVLRRLIRERQIDVLHTHDSRSDVIGGLVARMSRIPLVAFAHGWVNWTRVLSKDHLYAWLETVAVSKADHVIAASRAVMEDVRQRGTEASRITLLPLGIDTERFRPRGVRARVRESFGIAPGSTLVGTVSRLHPWKGHDILLEAAAELIPEHPELRFLWVGDAAFGGHDHYRAQLEERAGTLGIRDHIIFAGSRDDIPDILNGLDLFVLPSLKEPFGLVLLEAQACELPVVASRVGGIPEIVRDGETGTLVDPGHPALLAAAMADLLRNPSRRQAMGQAGRDHVVQHFSAERMVRETESLYEQVAATGRRHAPRKEVARL